jgi:diguanylate cyclase (GGDEF)-like protein
MLKTSIRQSDPACQYGGEEFAVILIDTNLNNTEMILGRFKDALETHLFQFDSNEFHLTVSIGPALFDNAESISGSELVNRTEPDCDL